MLRSCLYRSMVHSPADIRLSPVSIQKIEDQSGPTDLMQRWEDGPGYIFLESPDDQEELASYLKDREVEGVKSVHFYSPAIWMRVRKRPITWSLTLRDFRAEWQHLQAAANRRSSRSCSYAQKLTWSYASKGSQRLYDW